MSASTGDIVSRVYGNFRGVDFRGEEINIRRSPDSLNVWKDYRKTESIRTRPGMKLDISLTDRIYGISFYKGYTMIHSGNRIYRKLASVGDLIELYDNANKAPSIAFVYEDVWYFMDGKNYLKYKDGEITEVEGYVPTTSIGRSPGGSGKIHEDVNMLSDYRKNSFLPDGKSAEFFLDVTKFDNDFVPEVTVNGAALAADKYTYSPNEGKITILGKPEDLLPKTDGQDNVIVKFKKTVTGYKNNVLKCTLLQVFDNRVFASGNPDYPNYVWHCSLNDPTYWSDLDYYREGMDSAQIKGLVAGNNALWVFREPSEANTNVFYHTPTLDSDYGKIYPSSHSSITIGCDGKAINFNDDIIFFSKRGMEGISGDITTEQVAAHRSTLVDRKLISEANYRNMILEEWEGYLLVIFGKNVYLADSRSKFTYEDHIEYDWFYWELDKEITCAKVYNGILYLGTMYNGIYTIRTDTGSDGEYLWQTDNGRAYESYWVTPLDKFQAPSKLKTTNKRGCVAEATGDITVYAKTEDTDFELIGEYKDIKDYFVSRIKRKKFKDIQLKFHSKSRFSLETVTLECFIGGYIKR
jgi:hypothetical protein